MKTVDKIISIDKKLCVFEKKQLEVVFFFKFCGENKFNLFLFCLRKIAIKTKNRSLGKLSSILSQMKKKLLCFGFG